MDQPKMTEEEREAEAAKWGPTKKPDNWAGYEDCTEEYYRDLGLERKVLWLPAKLLVIIETLAKRAKKHPDALLKEWLDDRVKAEYQAIQARLEQIKKGQP